MPNGYEGNLKKEEIMEGLTGYKDAKKIKANTVAFIDKYGNDVIRFYRTNIITVTPAGVVILNSGGYRTATTKRRINEFLKTRYHEAVVITQSNSLWYLCTPAQKLYFADGIRIDKEMNVFGGGSYFSHLAMLNIIHTYVHDYCIAMQGSSGSGLDFSIEGYIDIRPQDLYDLMQEKMYPAILINNALLEFPVNKEDNEIILQALSNHCAPNLSSAASKFSSSLTKYMKIIFGFSA